MAKYKVGDKVWLREAEGFDIDEDGKASWPIEPRQTAIIISVGYAGEAYTVKLEDPSLCPHLPDTFSVELDQIEGLA